LSAGAAGLNGGYSQYVVALVSDVGKNPDRLSYTDAAGLRMIGTMAARLISKTRVSKGQRVLISGAGGGIGSLAVQLAKLRGAQVIGITSGRHADFLRSVGVDEQIDYTQGEWTAKAKNIDVGIDSVGGATHREHVQDGEGGRRVHKRAAESRGHARDVRDRRRRLHIGTGR
jgi:NADPH:quinone reductase-like Zn-dependent oxidoreductase